MRILMLGNSLTAANDMPQTLARLLGAEVSAHTRGGARLAEQLNPKTYMGARTAKVIATGGIDVVVLQEASTHPVRSRAAYLRSVCGLARAASAVDAMPVIFSTWALLQGARPLERLNMTHDEMDASLCEAFAEAARLTAAPVADVRAAFACEADLVTLYAADGVHPSLKGSELAAEVIARTIRASSKT